MNLVEKAFRQLYADKPYIYTSSIKYSWKFSEYNANIRKRGNYLEVRANKLWRGIGEEIQIGLIQHLLMKLFREKKETLNTELYTSFIKNVPEYTPKNLSHPVLEASFERVNAKYFEGLMERPNLRWGSHSRRQLGLYNFHNDTITISRLFEKEAELLDYIIYHELLHKHLKFESKNGNCRHHTPAFKRMERKFERYDEMEEKISKVVKEKRFSQLFNFLLN